VAASADPRDFERLLRVGRRSPATIADVEERAEFCAIASAEAVMKNWCGAPGGKVLAGARLRTGTLESQPATTVSELPLNSSRQSWPRPL